MCGWGCRYIVGVARCVVVVTRCAVVVTRYVLNVDSNAFGVVSWTEFDTRYMLNVTMFAVDVISKSDKFHVALTEFAIAWFSVDINIDVKRCGAPIKYVFDCTR